MQYYRILERVGIASLIYDKNKESNAILRGTLNISKEEKINLIELIFDPKIFRKLEFITKQIKRFDEYATTL